MWGVSEAVLHRAISKLPLFNTPTHPKWHSANTLYSVLPSDLAACFTFFVRPMVLAWLLSASLAA